jgi:predicted nuclease with TOPRIM domain
MADDYFKVKDQYTAQELINKKLIVEASQLDRDNIELKSQVQKLQTKLDRITQEFEDFLHNFDNPLQEKHPEEKPENILHMPKAEARKAAQ